MAIEEAFSLHDTLRGGELQQAWQDCLHEWSDVPLAVREGSRAYVDGLREQFLSVLDDIHDPLEQQAAGATFYAQLKSEWFLLNTQAGHQIARGNVNEAIFCHAGLLTAFLNSLEPHLNHEHIRRITMFLSRPTSSSPLDASTTAPRYTQEQKGVSPSHSPEQTACLAEDSEENALAPASSDSLLETEPTEFALTVLSQSPADVYTELALLRAEQEALFTETNTTSVGDVVQVLRNLEDRITELRRIVDALREQQRAFQREFGTKEPKDVVKQMRRLSLEVQNLQREVHETRIGQDFLKREFGCADPVRIVEALQVLQDHLSVMESRFAQIGTVLEVLEQELGTRDPAAIRSLIRERHDAIHTLSLKLSQYEADRRRLLIELGVCEADEILAAWQGNRAPQRRAA
jgi:hypothetical protein